MKNETYQKSKNVRGVGWIESFFTGIAKIKGLDGVLLNEILVDEKGKTEGIVVGFDENFVEAIFLDENFAIDKPIFSTGKTLQIPVSDNYLGRVVNGIGEPRDGKQKIKGDFREVFSDAPKTIDRQPIERPLTTGIKIIDATLPIGRGQRELIVGDRKLGKSTIALDIILNQDEASPTVYCVYVLCGRKDSEIDNITAKLNSTGASRYTVLVAAPSNAPFAEQFLAPFVGTTIAEYFMKSGKDALIIYDDLSSHAKVARSISLLLKRAPGREVYPGDIFSTHSSLLERSGQLKQELGASLTAIPIIETQEGDLASYIPTNLISITDGQIYLSRDLYDKNFLPAIDIGLSVSRIGSKVQPVLLKDATRDLRLVLAQNRELEKLTELESNLSAESQGRILRGKLISQILKQSKHTFVSWQDQVLLISVVLLGKLDHISPDSLSSVEKYFIEYLNARHKMLIGKINKAKYMTEFSDELSKATDEFLNQFEGRKQ